MVLEESFQLPSSPSAASPTKGKKQRPTRPLPTDRIAFSKQLDLLRAFAAASGPSGKMVTNNDVADILRMKGSTVSLANPFFVDIRLLQKADGGHIPSAEVVSFNRSYEWNPEGASHKLAPLIEHTWFAQELMPKLRFRELGEDEAITDLAEAVQARPDYRSQLRVLLDYMEASGLIVREGSQIRLAQPGSQPSETVPAEQQLPAAKPEPQIIRPSPVSAAVSKPTEGVVQFHVSVRVEMSEFAGWQADRIAAFFNGIAQVLAAKGPAEGEDASE